MTSDRVRPTRLKMVLLSLIFIFSTLGLAQEDFDESGPDALIIYEVHGDTLLNPQENPAAATDDELEDIMLDRAYHEVLWQDFATLIPLRYRMSITRLTIYTDGEDDILASVTPNPDNFDTWTLALDALDGTYMSDDLIHTLIHEFGHVLTLSAEQVPRSLEVLESDDDAVFERAEGACPAFFTGEGCSEQTSYINTYFQRFWADIYAQSFKLEPGDLFERYPEQFVTEYASENPGEDIAEAWTFFVLKDEPSGASVADQKVRFFYEYPELVKLREVIRRNLQILE